MYQQRWLRLFNYFTNCGVQNLLLVRHEMLREKARRDDYFCPAHITSSVRFTCWITILYYTIRYDTIRYDIKYEFEVTYCCYFTPPDVITLSTKLLLYYTRHECVHSELKFKSRGRRPLNLKRAISPWKISFLNYSRRATAVKYVFWVILVVVRNSDVYVFL